MVASVAKLAIRLLFRKKALSTQLVGVQTGQKVLIVGKYAINAGMAIAVKIRIITIYLCALPTTEEKPQRSICFQSGLAHPQWRMDIIAMQEATCVPTHGSKIWAYGFDVQMENDHGIIIRFQQNDRLLLQRAGFF